MPARKRPRPSFEPASRPADDPPRATTGWVYRSEAAAPPAPRAPDEPAPALELPRPVPPRVRPQRVLDVLGVPFTFIIVTSMPLARALRRARL